MPGEETPRILSSMWLSFISLPSPSAVFSFNAAVSIGANSARMAFLFSSSRSCGSVSTENERANDASIAAVLSRLPANVSINRSELSGGSLNFALRTE
ncbi:Uncharacterised protein [uncultured archaeon]|nr:Uncharacterised protein [uncultured archaeon]